MDYTVEILEDYGDLGKLFAVTVDGQEYRIAARSEDDIPDALEVAMSPRDNQSYPTAAVDLAAYAAQKRWEKEVGGITLNGMSVATDDRSKMMISGARVAAEADPNFVTQWKAADGTFVTIDAAAVIAISDTMLAHVSSCFAIEAQVLAGIQNETIKTVEDIDAAFA
ncbi:DUF4376 domain-containing protein [Ochrobactrum soli]|uniref:DUF4376 domain-containing protein n=1 Tax=Ochrobactrum soli TaxID=2448455 RepID=A0A2P9HHI3_9HYPH|nr:DUF4376 domain-containing protein [[Ochrobactrum] soli]SPL63575.1 hypothetical protein OHAE_3507 [[Ochrobactrum] soli]